MALRRSLLQRALSLRSAALSTPGSVAAAVESAQAQGSGVARALQQRLLSLPAAQERSSSSASTSGDLQPHPEQQGASQHAAVGEAQTDTQESDATSGGGPAGSAAAATSQAWGSAAAGHPDMQQQQQHLQQPQAHDAGVEVGEQQQQKRLQQRLWTQRRRWQPQGDAAGERQTAEGAPEGSRSEQPGRYRQPRRKKAWSGPPADPLVPTLLHYTHTCAAVVELMRQHEGQFSVRELTVAFRRMGKLHAAVYHQAPPPEISPEQSGNGNRDNCAALFEMAMPHFASMDSQALATAVWMCARFHWLPSAEQRAAWEEAAWARRSQINLIETANIFFSLGVLHWVPSSQPLLEALMDQALERREELTPWLICNMLWGSARVVAEHFHPGPERVTQLVELSLPQLHTFLPESFCSLLFSLACLRCRPDDAALTAILDQFEWKVPHSTNRQLVTAVWAMGALQIGSLVTERLWDSIEQQVLKQADEFNFSSAPLFLFGAARMQLQPSDALLQLLLSKSQEFGATLRTGDVAVILWALAKLGHKAGGPQLPSTIVADMVQRWLDCHERRRPATMRHVSALLWACANLKYNMPREQLRSIIAEAEQLCGGNGAHAGPRQPLTTTDATMLLAAFETYSSAEGLAFLKRQLIGSSGSRPQVQRRRGSWRPPRSPRDGATDGSPDDDLQLPAAGGMELQTDEVVIGLERDVRPHL